MRIQVFQKGFMTPAAVIWAAGLFVAMAPLQNLVATSQAPEEIQTPAVVTPQGDAIEEDGARRFCEWGFSKNMCKGELVDGEWFTVSCPERCWTLVGNQAYLKVPFSNNPDLCCDETTCDETHDLNGTLVAWMNYRIRENDSCPMRGWWEGRWTLYDVDGQYVKAEGTWKGSLGVGTHRVPDCLESHDSPCNRECEKCYEAIMFPISLPSRWDIHVEGTMDGRVVWGHFEGSEIHASMQGWYTAWGFNNELIPPTERNWSFCGTTDGVVERPCD